MIVVIDSSVWISIALGNLKPIKQAVESGDLIALAREQMFDEIEDVLQREKFRRWLTLNEAYLFIDQLKRITQVIAVSEPFPEFQDPKDRYLLAMLEHSDAYCLVTGDRALLELGRHEEKPIIAARQLIDLLT